MSLRYEAANIWNKLQPSVKCVSLLSTFELERDRMQVGHNPTKF